MRADEILNQIDDALEDWTVSDDAMRSRPAPDTPAEPSGIRGATPTVQITDEAGEWQEVFGVASIEIQPVIPDGVVEAWAALAERVREAELERVRQAQALMEAFTRTYSEVVKPAVEAAGQTISTAVAALQRAGLVDDDCKPVRPRDRPAWQSPYGPPRRRR